MDHEYILFCTPEQPETSANRQFRCSWSGGRSTMQASKGLRQRRPGAGFFPVRRRSACLGCRAAAGETARRGIRSIASLHARLPITGLAHAALLSSRSQHARPLCRPEGLRRIGRSRVAFQPPAQGRTGLVAVHGDRQKLPTRNFADSGAEPVEALRSAFFDVLLQSCPDQDLLSRRRRRHPRAAGGSGIPTWPVRKTGGVAGIVAPCCKKGVLPAVRYAPITSFRKPEVPFAPDRGSAHGCHASPRRC